MPGRTKELTDIDLLLFIAVIAFVMMHIGAMLFLEKDFLEPQTFSNILNASTVLIIMSCGMNLVMIADGIDISMSDVTALISMSCAIYLDYQEDDVFISLLIALGISLAFGVVRGFLVAYSDVRPFIVSLVRIFFTRGVITIVHTAPFNVVSEALSVLENVRTDVPGLGTVNKLGKYVNAYVETDVTVAILTVIILFRVLKWTKLDRNFYAVSGNRQNALILGINMKRTRFLSHSLCGLLTGVGDYVHFPHVGSSSTSHAGSMGMNAIASSIIGKTLLIRGVGNIFGIFMGVLPPSTIRNTMSPVGLGQAWWTGIIMVGMLRVLLVVQSVVLARKHQRQRRKSMSSRSWECRG